MIILSMVCLALALIPAGLFLVNLRLYCPPRVRPCTDLPAVSILIPARNEEANIARALESILANQGVRFEVIVLDDHSSDRTAGIVGAFAKRDSRVRLETCPTLPSDWCGKQHACAVLAERARFPMLCFMDADVRLAPDGLARMAGFLADGDTGLASGVPRQELGTFWEKLLIPLIHFVLLGFLPLARMRRSTAPAYAAGCGQLFMARADAYRASGGHGAIRASMHDGIKLPRRFRENGYKTDLFDATDIASCRMYAGGREVFAGLSKNAVEGLAAPARIVPITLLLLFGQVLPFALLALPGLTLTERGVAAAASVVALMPRIMAVRRFHQPVLFAFLQPLAIVALLVIQWMALGRHLMGKPATWRGRSYARAAATAGLVITSLVCRGIEPKLKNFDLNDQHERAHTVRFPRTNVSFIVVADHKGSEQLEKWIRPVYERFGQSVAIAGVADVSKVPFGLRGLVRRAFVKELDYPVMLDWQGDVVRQFAPQKDNANVFVVATNGSVLRRWTGNANRETLAELELELESHAGTPR